MVKVNPLLQKKHALQVQVFRLESLFLTTDFFTHVTFYLILIRT